MNAYIIQPDYSTDLSRSDSLFEQKLALLRGIPADAGIIVLPEYSDVPCAAKSREDVLRLHERYFGRLMDACSEAAVRCGATLFVNALSEEETGYRNTTFCFDSSGKIAGKYFKAHIPPAEAERTKLDMEYTFEYGRPYTVVIDGVKYAFLTCYDFYFYEAFPMIAREEPDVIIGCSLQRSDTHSASEIMCRFAAYNTNAYVIRSSVSFDETSDVCGASMIVAPDGTVLTNMYGKTGIACAEIDPHAKYLKPAGFGNPPAPHWKYIEYGRRPRRYRNAGSGISKTELQLPYPRVCAHRGFPAVAPENSMPSLGAAVAMGADEIEFDLWPTSDGEIVSIHDKKLERVSDGEGKVYEHTLTELRKLDFGAKFNEHFRGLRIPLFEEILQKFAGRVIMNIHVKTLSDEYDTGAMKKIVGLVRQYDCEKYVYFMISHDGVIRKFRDYAPDIPVCVGHRSDRPYEIVDRAIELGAGKVQLFKPYFDQSMIDKAKDHGIKLNIFYADDPEEAEKYLDMGVDTVLTNDCGVVMPAVRSYIKK